MPTRLDFTKLDLMDALDLAILIEDEAYERYRYFSAQLGHRAHGDAASVFAVMAENEKKHGVDLLTRRKQMFGTAPMRVKRDDVFDIEAPDQGAPRSSMSTLQAFEVALAAEQKAFVFYDEALTNVQHPEIRALFTELRDEETEHVNLVLKAIAGLPPSAAQEWEEDEDELPSL